MAETNSELAADKSITLDELLDSQRKPVAAATIEAVPGDDSVVKVTPFLMASGDCACDFALVVPRASIASIAKADSVHYCCGNTLTVVNVRFSNEAYTDTFRQMTAKATTMRSTRRPPAVLLAPDDVRNVSFTSPIPRLGQSMFVPRARHASPGLTAADCYSEYQGNIDWNPGSPYWQCVFRNQLETCLQEANSGHIPRIENCKKYIDPHHPTGLPH